MAPGEQIQEPIGTELAQDLENLRVGLMRLHKALLDYERVHYERAFGRVASSGEMLQLVIHDQWFAWLHPLSDLIVRIDEVLDPQNPGSAQEGRETIAYARKLLTPVETGGSFGGNYYLALQREPAVVLAHAQVRRVLYKRVGPAGGSPPLT